MATNTYAVEVNVSYVDALRVIEHVAENGDFERLGLDVAQRLAGAAKKIAEGVAANRQVKKDDTEAVFNTVNDIMDCKSEYKRIHFTLDELDKALEKGDLHFMGRRIGYKDKLNTWVDLTAAPFTAVTVSYCQKCGGTHALGQACFSSTFFYPTLFYCVLCGTNYTAGAYHDCKNGTVKSNGKK